MESSQSLVPDFVAVSEKSRIDILLAFSRQRAADAELRSSQLTVEHLIDKLDKDGQLRAAIKESQVASARAADAGNRMRGIIIEVQKEVGHSLEGYRIDPESGNLIKPPSAPATPPTAAPEAKVVDLKKARGKNKK